MEQQLEIPLRRDLVFDQTSGRALQHAHQMTAISADPSPSPLSPSALAHPGRRGGNCTGIFGLPDIICIKIGHSLVDGK